MAVIKYIKQPLTASLAQYTDAELRKIELAISNLVEFSETVDVATIESDITALQSAVTTLQGDVTALEGSVSTLQSEVLALQAQSYSTAIVKPSDESITSDTSLNVDSHLVLPISSTGVWEFECMVNAFFGSSGLAIQSVFFFTGTLTPAPPAGGHQIEHRANGENLYDSSLAVTTVSTDVILANAQRTLLFRGLMRVATTGNLQFRWAQSTSSATALVIRAGSFIRARKVAS